MKRAIIFHGTDCTPDDFWYPWLKQQLENAGYEVLLPYYKDINHEPIAEFLPKVLSSIVLDEETTLIGHSAGVPLILAMLEKTDSKITKAVLVAGFSEPLDSNSDPVLQESYNWAKIKNSADEFVIFNSDNDPWGCDEKQGKRLQDKLGGTLIIKHDGHFGSNTMNQPYSKFPELLNKVLQDKAERIS